MAEDNPTNDPLLDLNKKLMDKVNNNPLIPDAIEDEIRKQNDKAVAWYKRQPLWVHVAIWTVIASLSAFVTKAVQPPPPPAPAPQVIVNTASAGAEGLDVESVELQKKHRVFTHHWRKLLERQLRYSGFSAVGGKRRLSEAEIAEAMAKVSDDQIVAAAEQVDGLGLQFRERSGDGERKSVLEFFVSLLKWIQEHPELVEAFLKILMLLAML